MKEMLFIGIEYAPISKKTQIKYEIHQNMIKLDVSSIQDIKSLLSVEQLQRK